MGAKYDVMLVSMGNNLVRAILATDLDRDTAWAAVEQYGKEYDTAQAFVIDDITGKNKVGQQYRGFLVEGFDNRKGGELNA
jgi:hypothetical protein